MYVVVGATGNSGSLIASRLLDQGKSVRVISREAERLNPLIARGAQPFIASSMEDEETMLRAFEGSKAVYYLINTPNTIPDWTTLGHRLASSLQRSGAKHLVVLGSFAAHLPMTNSHYDDFYALEQAINASPELNVIHLRPNFFLDNLFLSIPEIKAQGTISTPFAGHVKAPHVAIRDIASIAATELSNLTFKGKVAIELLGERDLSMDEIAAAIGAAVGKNVRYVQTSYEDMAARLERVKNTTPEMGVRLAHMYKVFNEGRVSWPNPPALRTETTLEQFLQEEFLPRYNAA
jgi:uncharacterized protein YbjT (DUF2867 family)